MLNANASEIAGVVGAIDPDVTVASTVTSGWINVATFQSYMAIIMAGTLGASATLDAKLEQASDSSGTGAKDISGKAITQLTQAGTDSDKQAIINVRGEDLDLDNDFNHFRLSVTVATATSDLGAIVVGMNPRSGAVADNDASTVDEIV